MQTAKSVNNSDKFLLQKKLTLNNSTRLLPISTIVIPVIKCYIMLHDNAGHYPIYLTVIEA